MGNEDQPLNIGEQILQATMYVCVWGGVDEKKLIETDGAAMSVEYRVVITRVPKTSYPYPRIL